VNNFSTPSFEDEPEENAPDARDESEETDETEEPKPDLTLKAPNFTTALAGQIPVGEDENSSAKQGESNERRGE
jgi:hypothetical protein